MSKDLDIINFVVSLIIKAVVILFLSKQSHQPTSHTKGTFSTDCKTSEFFENSPLSEAGKHPDFQVTLCLHFDTTEAKFAYIKSE